MLNLKILTPQKQIFEGTIDKLVVQTPNGETGILPGHTELLTAVVPGELKITQNGKDTVMASGEGLLTVADNQISILIDEAVAVTDLNQVAIAEARARALERLEEKLSDEEIATVEALIERADTHLKIKRRHHERTPV